VLAKLNVDAPGGKRERASITNSIRPRTSVARTPTGNGIAVGPIAGNPAGNGNGVGPNPALHDNILSSDSNVTRVTIRPRAENVLVGRAAALPLTDDDKTLARVEEGAGG